LETILSRSAKEEVVDLKRLPLSLLMLWAAWSSVVIVIGVGFAGGVTGIVAPLEGGDAISIIAWAIAGVLIFAPFLLLLTRLIGRLLK
jgi:hypothetical protein